MLKQYIPGINASISPKKHDENNLSEKLVNELHSQIENKSHLIHPPNEKDSFFVKFNGTLVNKQKHILQTSVQELHNDMILTVAEGVFVSARTADGNVCIGDTSLRKYMLKYIKPTRNINKITCGCKSCISAMLLSWSSPNVTFFYTGSHLNELKICTLIISTNFYFIFYI